MRLPKPQLTALALLALAVGCGVETAPPLVASLETAASPEASAAAEPLAPAEPASPVEPREQAAQYQAPFPNRSELFFPPATARRAMKRSGGGYESAVELIGVARVDEPYALLSIDGVPTPVAEGAQKNGVQVISLQPDDSVVLQRGRSRWTATLE